MRLWIDRLMRRRGVSPASDDLDFELVDRRHYRPGHDPHRPYREIVPEMNAKGRVDLGAVEHAIADHRLRTVRHLFGRLKREFHAAAKVDWRESAGDFEPDRDVPIVPAGVHLPRLCGTVGYGVRLFDRQRVHVGAEEHAAAIPPL